MARRAHDRRERGGGTGDILIVRCSQERKGSASFDRRREGGGTEVAAAGAGTDAGKKYCQPEFAANCISD